MEQSIGLAQCELFQEEGVDMNRVIVVRDKKSGRVKLVNVPKLGE